MLTKDVLSKYEMTIGIECHVQLATNSKLFSSSNNDSRESEPNSNINPIDYALPGMLPVLNRGAVDLAVKAGKALNSEISKISSFDRKHYFYPDLPKGYQTTQMYNPIIGPGVVHAPLEDGSYVDVRIHHAHMEEDAGKLTHYSDHSLVDLNRAGTPLIEIVSEPDMHSAQEAKAYANELYLLMTYAGVTRGDLYYGNMRFDVNVSVALKSAKELGKRAEVKNLNSFRSVERAAEYEFKRQVDLIEHEKEVVQETRGWDDSKQKTFSQRSKEDAQDYRYMPDADIPPIVLSDQEIADIQSRIPKLPNFYREAWSGLNLDRSVIDTIIGHQPVAVIVNEIVEEHGLNDMTRRVFNWFASVSAGDLDINVINSGYVDISKLVQLSNMVEDDKLSSTGAKEVFLSLFDEQFKNKSPEEIAKGKNLLQVSDVNAIATIVDEVLADPASQKSIDDIRNGKDKAIGYLVGQIMKKSKGQANPALAQKLIREKLI